MFNFLKRSAKNNLVDETARKAKIDTVYEEGEITGILILIEEFHNKFIDEIKKPNALNNFIKIIEDRLKNKDYVDDISPMVNAILDNFCVSPNPQEDNIKKAIRVVIKPNYEEIFHWYRPK